MADVSASGSYWSYNPFDEGINSLLFIFISIAAPLITAVRMHRENGWKTILAAAAGAFFLAGALMVALGAFQNLFSLYPNESSYVRTGKSMAAVLPDYGGSAGAILLWLSEKWRKEGGAARSVYSIVAHTLGCSLPSMPRCCSSFLRRQRQMW